MRKQIEELLVQVLDGDGGQAGNAVLHDLLVEHDLAVVQGDHLLAAARVGHHKRRRRVGELAEEAEVLAAGEGLGDEFRLAAGSRFDFRLLRCRNVEAATAAGRRATTATDVGPNCIYCSVFGHSYFRNDCSISS